MASDGRSLRSSISLDELIALNNEILALVRAGVPLELGLRQNPGALQRRLTRLTDAIASQLASGVDLGTAGAQANPGMPPIYQAMISAGLRSGRLSDALEGVTKAAENVAELRRLLIVSMVYPMAVVMMAYGLFIGMLLYVLPTLVMFSEKQPGWLLQLLTSISKSAAVWGPVIPIVIITLLLAWLYQTSRAMSLQPSRGSWNPRVPMISAMVRDARYATFAELLGLMVQHGVPLDEGLTSAAAATGDPELAKSAEVIAQQVTGGRQPDTTIIGRRFPTLVSWALGTSARGRLAECLRSAATSYHQRVTRRADFLRIYLPAMLTLCIGGSATLVYALSLFGPFTQMMQQIAAPGAGV